MIAATQEKLEIIQIWVYTIQVNRTWCTEGCKLTSLKVTVQHTSSIFWPLSTQSMLSFTRVKFAIMRMRKNYWLTQTHEVRILHRCFLPPVAGAKSFKSRRENRVVSLSLRIKQCCMCWAKCSTRSSSECRIYIGSDRLPVMNSPDSADLCNAVCHRNCQSQLSTSTCRSRETGFMGWYWTPFASVSVLNLPAKNENWLPAF